jgi:hypothetical protein
MGPLGIEYGGITGLTIFGGEGANVLYQQSTKRATYERK